MTKKKNKCPKCNKVLIHVGTWSSVRKNKHWLSCVKCAYKINITK